MNRRALLFISFLSLVSFSPALLLASLGEKPSSLGQMQKGKNERSKLSEKNKALVEIDLQELNSEEKTLKDEIIKIYQSAEKNNYQEEQKKIVKMGSKAKNPLEHILKEENDETMKWFALWVYSNITEGDRLNKVLEIALSSPSWLICLSAAQIIGEKKLVALEPELIKHLSDPALVVRNAIIASLGELAKPSSIKPILEQLHNVKNFRQGAPTFIFETAFNSLAKLAAYEAMDELIEFLDHDNRRLALKADEALQKITHHNFLSKTFSGNQLKSHWQNYLSTMKRQETMRPKIF